MKSSVPLLITCDLEIAHDHDLDEQGAILLRLKNDLEYLHVPITFFSTSDALAAFPDQVRTLSAAGHDFGSHGVTHAKEEDYRTLSYPKVVEYIRTVDETFKNVLDFKPHSFRGPRMTTSTMTHRALLEYGYRADFSSCPQRIDCFTASGYDPRWLFAPRKPYLSSPVSPFRKGNQPILMVPLSGSGFPFVSGLLFLMGYLFMKWYFHILLFEAQLISKPIVFLFHSYEFCTPKAVGVQKKLHRLYMSNRERRYEMILKLIRYMCSRNSVQCTTAKTFVHEYFKNIGGQLDNRVL